VPQLGSSIQQPQKTREASIVGSPPSPPPPNHLPERVKAPCQFRPAPDSQSKASTRPTCAPPPVYSAAGAGRGGGGAWTSRPVGSSAEAGQNSFFARPLIELPHVAVNHDANPHCCLAARPSSSAHQIFQFFWVLILGMVDELMIDKRKFTNLERDCVCGTVTAPIHLIHRGAEC
jgi:hypothetical protein